MGREREREHRENFPGGLGKMGVVRSVGARGRACGGREFSWEIGKTGVVRSVGARGRACGGREFSWEIGVCALPLRSAWGRARVAERIFLGDWQQQLGKGGRLPTKVHNSTFSQRPHKVHYCLRCLYALGSTPGHFISSWVGLFPLFHCLETQMCRCCQAQDSFGLIAAFTCVFSPVLGFVVQSV